MAEDRLLTPEEAAKRLALQPETVREWLRTGRFPGIKAGRLWRVRESDLQAYIRGEAPSPPTGTKGGFALAEP